jgi:phosphoribosylformylglycinamidine cyclo-ligase
MIAIVRRDALEQVVDVLTQAGERVAPLGSVIEAGGDRVVYDNHLDLAI